MMPCWSEICEQCFGETWCNIPEKWRPQLHHSESWKAQINAISILSIFKELYVGYPESEAPFFPWPVIKPGMWDFRWHKLEVSGIFVQSCTDFCWSLGTKSDSVWNKKSRAPWYASRRSLLYSYKPWDAAVCCYHLARISGSQPNNWLSPSVCIRSWSHQLWFQIFKV